VVAVTGVAFVVAIVVIVTDIICFDVIIKRGTGEGRSIADGRGSGASVYQHPSPFLKQGLFRYHLHPAMIIA